jgi:hypothetical protein
VAFLEQLMATFYSFAILLNQAVAPAQQLLGAMKCLFELGFEVFWVMLWPGHGVEFL